MSERFEKRRQIFVDKRVQGALVARVVLYWAFCCGAIMLMLLCWRMLTGPSADPVVHLAHLWSHYKPIAIAAGIVLPVLLVDAIQLSNRFAGPMVRLRRGLSLLADGRLDIAPLHFRRDDFWHEFALEFNRVAERMHQYRWPPSPGNPDPWSTNSNVEAPARAACPGAVPGGGEASDLAAKAANR